MKTILFLDHTPLVGGAQIVLLNYVKYLDKRKFKVVVVCSGESEYLVSEFKKYANKVYVIKFGKLKVFSLKSVLNFLKSTLEIKKIAKQEHIDILAANTERAFYSAAIVTLLNRKKLILFIRDYLYNKTILKILTTRTTKIFVVSKELQRFYSLGKNSEVLYPGTDMKIRLDRVEEGEVEEIRAKYGLQGKTVVGFVGRLVNWKGAHVLVEAAKKLDRKDVVYLIVGEFDPSNPTYQAELLKSQSQNVIFTGFTPKPELYYRFMDVYVHTSIEKEPYALGIIEAMGAKVPVIATNLGGSTELITDGRNGLLIEPDDSSQLADALTSLLDNPDLRGKIGETGFDSVIQKNDIMQEVKYLESVFKVL